MHAHMRKGVCMHAAHMCTCTCACLRAHMHVHICGTMCMCTCMYTHLCVYVEYSSPHEFVCVYVCMCVHACIYTHRHANVCVCMPAHPSVCSFFDKLKSFLVSLPGMSTIPSNLVSMLPVLSGSVFLENNRSPFRTLLKRHLPSQRFLAFSHSHEQAKWSTFTYFFSYFSYYS